MSSNHMGKPLKNPCNLPIQANDLKCTSLSVPSTECGKSMEIIHKKHVARKWEEHLVEWPLQIQNFDDFPRKLLTFFWTRLRNVRDHTQREPWDGRSWPRMFKDCSVQDWTAADFHGHYIGLVWARLSMVQHSLWENLIHKIIQPKHVNDSCCTGRSLPFGCTVLRAHRARQISRTWSNSGSAHSYPHMPQLGTGPGWQSAIFLTTNVCSHKHAKVHFPDSANSESQILCWLLLQ